MRTVGRSIFGGKQAGVDGRRKHEGGPGRNWGQTRISLLGPPSHSTARGLNSRVNASGVALRTPLGIVSPFEVSVKSRVAQPVPFFPFESFEEDLLCLRNINKGS